MKKLFFLFLGWFIVVNLFALIGANRLNLVPDTAYTWINPEDTQQEQTWNPIQLHAKWDSFWYLDIAENGYSYKGQGELSNIVFFPLYPFLMKTLSFAMGGNLVLAGWVISALSLFLALLYLFRLIREFHPQIDPYLPVLLLLIFPTAFFLNAVYTESLFLFLSIASLYYVFKGKYGMAGVFGALAALTRVTGILLIVPFAWEYYKRHGLSARTLFQRRTLALAAIPTATLSFFLFHWFRFGDPFLFLRVEKTWGRAFTLNQDHFVFLSHPALANFLLDVLFAVFALAATWFVFRRLRVSYGLYMLATLAVAIGTGTLMSVGRYILVLFPIFILGALLMKTHDLVRYGWIFVSLLLFALYTILFTSYYWSG
ncbi:hypothetical protein KKI17_02410 [Patescibacteria group bacterium]|nr:hypothetical protein [Patescibacteria group bacterium]